MFEVPPSEGFTVSDIRIGDVPITYGGQLAQHMTVRLIGLAVPGSFDPKPLPCEHSALIDPANPEYLIQPRPNGVPRATRSPPSTTRTWLRERAGAGRGAAAGHRQIQGNVLPGFIKPTLQLCALKIEDVELAKGWIREISGEITALGRPWNRGGRCGHCAAIARLRRAPRRIPAAVDDAWANISFSYTGLAKLLAGGSYENDLARFEDPGFGAGSQPARRYSAIQSTLTPKATPPTGSSAAQTKSFVLLCVGADNTAGACN